ncbi:MULTISPECIES: hypothetical protein [Cyanophyceae]|uniref:hypothetical protein n=1 Tax=Cyanophyceae TaxID=3028117 RepID=UPI0002FB2DCB|nr:MULTISPECIES: hypothetical protein [Cyanophyceae]
MTLIPPGDRQLFGIDLRQIWIGLNIELIVTRVFRQVYNYNNLKLRKATSIANVVISF